jgi:acetylornithine deacetylase/succinyl-diaminopimelate desuccinylase-like protein
MATSIDWDAASKESLELLRALVRVPTVNPPGNERPAADLLARLFTQEGIEHVVLESEPTRASVIARLRGTGRKPPLLLNGHLDVVPVDREKWSHDPFGAEIVDGCVWGRGTLDMKNMVAMSAMTLVLCKRHGVELDRDLIFAGVADEEWGSRLGALYLVERHPELVRSEYVLNEVGGHTLHMGPRRYYPIQVAEKGICWFELIAHGEPGHGSMPHPCNSIGHIAEAITALTRADLPVHVTPVVERFLRTIAKGAPFPGNVVLPLLVQPALARTLLEVVRKSDPAKARGLGAMLSDTVSPNILSAGSKVNVIPSQASVQVDGRVLPGASIATFLERIREVVGPHVELVVHEQHDGVSFTEDTPLFRAIEKTLFRHDPAAIPVPYMIPGYTDSFAYARLGAICYGFSPVQLASDMEFTSMYHGHNERIPVAGYAWGQRVLFDLVREFCEAP